MTEFAVENRGTFSYWHSTEWSLNNVLHGFVGVSKNFSEEDEPSKEAFLQNVLGIKSLILLKQVHSNSIFFCAGEPPSCPPEADAIIMPRKSAPRAIGIKTADCVPLLIKTPTHIAAIHAGWRGLASGVIERTLAMLGDITKASVLIGPCAGANRYEVGGDVITALQPYGLYTPNGNGKFFLALANTAAHIIRSTTDGQCKISIFNECTITNTQFHSYRREGQSNGRNLAFIVG